MLLANRMYRSPDGADGGSSGQQPTQQNTQQPDNGQQPAQQSFQNLLERNSNDAQRVAWLLFQENYQHRQELRTAQGRVTELEQEMQQLNGRLPAEGNIVLDTDQATLWQQYQTLGTPEQLGQTLRTDLLRQAADAHGYKASALQTLAGDLRIELRQEDRDGQTVPVAYVIQGENDAIPLDQYAQTHWTDFINSLAQQPQQGGGMMRQTPAGTPPQTNPVQTTLNKRYERPDKE